MPSRTRARVIFALLIAVAAAFAAYSFTLSKTNLIDAPPGYENADTNKFRGYEPAPAWFGEGKVNGQMLLTTALSKKSQGALAVYGPSTADGDNVMGIVTTYSDASYKAAAQELSNCKSRVGCNLLGKEEGRIVETAVGQGVYWKNQNGWEVRIPIKGGSIYMLSQVHNDVEPYLKAVRRG